MSEVAYPFFIFPLASEMLFVLSERLLAQNIPEIRLKRVLSELIKEIVSDTFVSSAYDPQCTPSVASLEPVFFRLANCTVMSLSEASMSRLVHLMTASIKFQLLSLACPTQMLPLVLRHIDKIAELADSAELKDRLDALASRFSDLARTVGYPGLAAARADILAVLQPAKVKVSVFLQTSRQAPDGTLLTRRSFVVGRTTPSLPGVVRHFDAAGVPLAPTTGVLAAFPHPHAPGGDAALPSEPLTQPSRNVPIWVTEPDFESLPDELATNVYIKPYPARTDLPRTSAPALTLTALLAAATAVGTAARFANGALQPPSASPLSRIDAHSAASPFSPRSPGSAAVNRVSTVSAFHQALGVVDLPELGDFGLAVDLDDAFGVEVSSGSPTARREPKVTAPSLAGFTKLSLVSAAVPGLQDDVAGSDEEEEDDLLAMMDAL
jgi:hypothetical protein